MQKGYIYQANGAWHLRYRVGDKQVSRKLADYNDQYRTKRSVRPLADEVLDPLNQGLQVNGPMTLQQYAETVYFPNIKTKKSPSTYKGYFNLYSKQIQPRIGGLRLSTCTTADMQRVLYRIDEQEELSHQSFLNINSVLSAIFTHARRSGTLQGPNPTDGVEIPEGKRTKKTHKYTAEEVETITNAVDGVARCAVVVAAWTGLSLAELRGLKWVDIDFENERLRVERTVWHKEIIDTKTEHRKDAVHLLPNVISELEEHRKRNPGTKWVFEGPRAFPLDLATLGSKRIKDALKGTGVEWHGLHAFRRGLGTQLYNSGTKIVTVGKVLRHGSGSEVTLKSYVEIEEQTRVNALKNLHQKKKQRRNLCDRCCRNFRNGSSGQMGCTHQRSKGRIRDIGRSNSRSSSRVGSRLDSANSYKKNTGKFGVFQAGNKHGNTIPDRTDASNLAKSLASVVPGQNE